jgi:hypothetical protein
VHCVGVSYWRWHALVTESAAVTAAANSSLCTMRVFLVRLSMIAMQYTQLHADMIMAVPSLRAAAAELRTEQQASSQRLKALVQENLCLVQYLSDLQT